MKKIKWSIVFFIILTLALSTGTSFLALNQVKKGKSDKDTQKMTVALVNEDQGANLSGKKIEFGNEFITSVEKDNTHDWYVVSRGVAESGLARNVYNMMIVIPNDFSKKALSIESNAPEKVTLNYKVNTTGNNDVKAEAEKTASSILGDFNSRIIDVYFASIIGNLQNAQDNITTLVKKEQTYTDVYNKEVHSPLAGYTQQFKSVQDQTGVAKGSFKGLQEILNGFSNNLNEGMKSNQTSQTAFGDFNKMKEANGLVLKDFTTQLTQFDQSMNTTDIVQQFANLELANKVIYNQFQLKEEQPNILSDSAGMQKYLSDNSAKIRSYSTELANTIGPGLTASITEKLKQEISNSSEGHQDVYLNKFFDAPDNHANQKIQEAINQLPSLNKDDIQNIGLSDGTKKELENVIDITNKYNAKKLYTPTRGTDTIPMVEMIKKIKDNLTTSGVEVNDKAVLPATKKEGQYITLNVPDDYEVTSVKLVIGNEADYTKEYLENKKVVLPATDKGDFEIKATLRLKNANSNISVFEPVTWSWNLTQEDTDYVIDNPSSDMKPKPTEPPILGQSRTITNQNPLKRVKKSDSQTQNSGSQTGGSDSQTQNGGSQTGGSDGQTQNGSGQTSGSDGQTQNGGSQTGGSDGQTQNGGSQTSGSDGQTQNGGSQTSGSDGQTQNGGSQTGKNDGETQTEQPPTKDEETNTEGEWKPVNNNYITHQVMSSLDPNATNKLVQAVEDTIKNYQKLSNMYNLYYGFEASADLPEDFNQKSLTDLTESHQDSLYYLFNKRDVLDLLAEYIAKQTTEEVQKQTKDLKDKLDAYLQLVDEADKNSTHLTEVIKQTTEQANAMNTNLTQTLKDLATWRETSNKLIDQQGKVVTNSDGEQTATLALDGEFKSIFTQSQTLADQSKGNLISADDVYKTFDNIDDQAKTIQDSGDSLVGQATRLSNDLSKKLIDDKDYLKNFTKVLANSRVGERQNENLYSFLANPVQKKNDGVVVAADTFTPYLLVLICFIVSLFTAYVISNQERKRIEKSAFEEEMSLVLKNVPITTVQAGIGIVEGILIGGISGYLLKINHAEFLVWISMFTSIMLVLVLISGYLLRQMKMIGMFILLATCSLYLFLTDAVGLNLDKMSTAAKIREFSPLQYIESMITGFANDRANWSTIMYSLMAAVVIGFVVNLFVIRKYRAEERDEYEADSHTS
ncbi:type VII secretion protein EsaA [Bacillus clarus]|uniref:Type VII secretion system accessory factor EsaA n=1 Tax=Bacillus clarus TaxID=2338372 RepID=A0A090YC24_9BACI|nr:type VII secretion protein EsaA [Bacillus clarus]KFM95721.1 type VII secretion protein EsaA [Bacillus clarus]RFT63497.1 type VII secretion protein EsaA [Bacillus clarus]